MTDIIAIIKSIGIPEIKYDKNTYLLRQSDPVPAMYYCQNASLTISYINSNGNEFILKVDEDYTGFLGEMEFFQGDNHSLFSVKANKPGIKYAIPQHHFLKMLSKNHDIFLALMASMSRRYNRNMQTLIANLTQPTKTSVINQILEAKNLANGKPFKLPMTLGAKKIGITSRSYRRIVHELIDEQKIAKIGTSYQVLDPSFKPTKTDFCLHK